MNYIFKKLLLFSFLLHTAMSLSHAETLQITQQRIDEHEKAISKLIYNRQAKRYALYTALSGVAACTLYYFLSDHDIHVFPNFDHKQYVTNERMYESQKQFCKDLVETYGLTPQKALVAQVEQKKTAVLPDMFWSFVGKLKSSSVSIAQFGLASILLTKTEGIFFSNESIGWFYTTEQSIFEKAQNCINWATVCDADMRPDSLRTQTSKNLNKQFFIEAAHEYTDSLMALIGFMNYKVKCLEKHTLRVSLSAFTSIIEAVTLYATELTLKLEDRITGNAPHALQDEVRKTDRLIESLYKKFLIMEKKQA